MSSTTRTYRKKKRAQSEEETRQRIIEAAVATHEQKGAASTISEIARLAGVGRVTLYRHFPDEASLMTACTGHYLAEHPLPDIASWAAIDDPRVRLRTGLAETYAYHRATVAMMTQSEHAVALNPVLAELMEPLTAFWTEASTLLAGGWPPQTSSVIEPVVVLALALPTWRILAVQQGLTDDECVDLFFGIITSLDGHAARSQFAESSERSQNERHPAPDPQAN